MTLWKISSADDVPIGAKPVLDAIPLKWAHDADSGETRYSHDEDVAAKRCSCVCAACSRPLTPVLPGQPHRTRPSSHFRHPEGTTKVGCVVVSARLAAVRKRAGITPPRRWADYGVTLGLHRCGSSSSTWAAGCVGSLVRTSFR